jgi:predicted lipid-binding transport protein (Tim44 family)
MRDVFDIYTIIFLALAVFIFLRLRSVLGQRTGRERPPYDPYSARDTIRPQSDKVVALPGRAPDTAQQKSSEPAEPSDRWKGIAEPGSALAAGLDAVAREDELRSKHLVGARAAYK